MSKACGNWKWYLVVTFTYSLLLLSLSLCLFWSLSLSVYRETQVRLESLVYKETLVLRYDTRKNTRPISTTVLHYTFRI